MPACHRSAVMPQNALRRLVQSIFLNEVFNQHRSSVSCCKGTQHILAFCYHNQFSCSVVVARGIIGTVASAVKEDSMKLCVTYCAKNKRDGSLPPDGLYNSLRIHRFASYCKEKHLNWAILSAKYGLFFPEESRQRYDVTFRSNPAYWLGTQVVAGGEGLPRSKSDIILKELVKAVAAQIATHSVSKIVYYYENRGPIQPPKGYLALLHSVVDNCNRVHSWPELLECTSEHGTISATVRLDFDP